MKTASNRVSRMLAKGLYKSSPKAIARNEMYIGNIRYLRSKLSQKESKIKSNIVNALKRS